MRSYVLARSLRRGDIIERTEIGKPQVYIVESNTIYNQYREILMRHKESGALKSLTVHPNDQFLQVGMLREVKQ
jgi:hypothetical protein